MFFFRLKYDAPSYKDELNLGGYVSLQKSDRFLIKIHKNNDDQWVKVKTKNHRGEIRNTLKFIKLTKSRVTGLFAYKQTNEQSFSHPKRPNLPPFGRG